MAGTTAMGGLVEGPAREVACTTLLELERFLERCVAVSRAAYMGAMRRVGVRRALHRFRRDHALDRARSAAHAGDAPTITLVRQLVRLWRAGASPAELFALAMVPLRSIEQLVGDAPRSLDQIDQEEQHLNGVENELQMRRRIRGTQPRGLTAQELRDEALVCASIIAIHRERERALLAEATRIERAAGMVA